MDLLKLLVIFALIIGVMKFKKPLNVAIAAGIVGAVILYQIDIVQALMIVVASSVSRATITIVLSFYSITFLQRMLEKRGQLSLAEKSLSGIFNSRRVNAMIAPFIIGLLPSPGAVVIAAPIVDNAGGDYISREDKTFIASYFRHIPEAFLPTYSSIILALQLSGIDMAAFVLAMLPMVGVLFLLGYYLFVRKIPRETGLSDSEDKKEDAKNLGRSLWTIALTIAIILVLKWPVYLAVLPVIVLSCIINKFSVREFVPLFASAFEPRLVSNAIVIMAFKDILTYTGVINRLPAAFACLPMPPAVIFSLIFLLGTIVAGSQAIIALCMPLAFAAIPDGGLGLMVLLMCMTYIAMQISPAHVCLAIIIEVFDTSFLDLVKRTVLVMVWFLLIVSVYSCLLSLL